VKLPTCEPTDVRSTSQMTKEGAEESEQPRSQPRTAVVPETGKQQAFPHECAFIFATGQQQHGHGAQSTSGHGGHLLWARLKFSKANTREYSCGSSSLGSHPLVRQLLRPRYRAKRLEAAMSSGVSICVAATRLAIDFTVLHCDACSLICASVRSLFRQSAMVLHGAFCIYAPLRQRRPTLHRHDAGQPAHLVGKQELVLLRLLQALPLLEAVPVGRVVVTIILQAQSRCCIISLTLLRLTCYACESWQERGQSKDSALGVAQRS